MGCCWISTPSLSKNEVSCKGKWKNMKFRILSPFLFLDRNQEEEMTYFSQLVVQKNC